MPPKTPTPKSNNGSQNANPNANNASQNANPNNKCPTCIRTTSQSTSSLYLPIENETRTCFFTRISPKMVNNGIYEEFWISNVYIF